MERRGIMKTMIIIIITDDNDSVAKTLQRHSTTSMVVLYTLFYQFL